jgi:hypothetical protein
MGFFPSILFLCWGSIRVSRHFGQSPAERFWIFIASAALHLGAISTIASIFGRLNPVVWLSMQAALLAAILYWTRRSAPPIRLPALSGPGERIEKMRSSAWGWAIVEGILLLGAASFILLSGIDQWLTPISSFDEKMYHASRVLYFLQNESVFPFVTHNDRQIVFPFGGELFFLWPVLFTKSELAGRMVFWLGYPASALGLYFLIRESGVPRMGALAGVVVFASTPIVLRYSVGLKPALWFTAFIIGAGFWTVKSLRATEDAGRPLFLSALFIILGVNAKPTALAILPVLPIVAWFAGSGRNRAHNLTPVLLGMAAGLLFSGLAVTFGCNLLDHGHILGPAAMRKVHMADIGWMQLYTHAIRLSFLLLEAPHIPWEWLREAMDAFGREAIALLGADAPLPLENPGSWPGAFRFSTPVYANKYSLPGVFWLPLLLAGVWTALRGIGRRSHRALSLAATSSISALLLAGTVFSIRWMPLSGIPERFLIAPYAVGIAVGIVVLRGFIQGRVATGAIVGVLIVLTAFFPLKQKLHRVKSAIAGPAPVHEYSKPFTEPLDHIPPGASILFAGSQSALDYPLFAPQKGYGNRVISWGKREFDKKVMEDVIEREGITHILIESDCWLRFHWDPPVDISQMIEWLSKRDGTDEIPLSTRGMRLYATAGP